VASVSIDAIQTFGRPQTQKSLHIGEIGKRVFKMQADSVKVLLNFMYIGAGIRKKINK
jgi:hypothetical protein